MCEANYSSLNFSAICRCRYGPVVPENRHVQSTRHT